MECSKLHQNDIPITYPNFCAIVFGGKCKRPSLMHWLWYSVRLLDSSKAASSESHTIKWSHLSFIPSVQPTSLKKC